MPKSRPKLEGRKADPPDRLKGKEFEELCLIDGKWNESRGHYCMGRYGVQVSFRAGDNGQAELHPVQSLPDFEGLLPIYGRQFVFDCKVCGAASYSLHDDRFKKRQLSHMLKRGDFGAVCFLLIHFSKRDLKTRQDPAVTYAFPIHSKHQFWQEFDRGEVKSISRTHCEEHAIQVPWHVPKQARKPRPDLLAGIQGVYCRVREL